MRSRHAGQLLFDLSEPGHCALRLPALDMPERPVDELLPAAALPGIADPHPYQPAESIQGMLHLLYEMQRLLDFGIHAPTGYFPQTVPEALMCEPTETESKETLDLFAETLFQITEESPELLREAPHTTAISRPDEVGAARKPTLCHCG